jgi:hypothetical protein
VAPRCFIAHQERRRRTRQKQNPASRSARAIGAFIDGWNDHPRPFTWVKDADEILAKVEHAKAKTSALTRH